MKQPAYILFFLAALLHACGGASPATSSLTESWEDETLLIVTRGVETGSLDIASTAHPEHMQQHMLDLTGDAVVIQRHLGTLVLNRGMGGNILVLDGALAVTGQIFVDNCNPQDAEYLNPTQLAVACYDDKSLWIIDIPSRAVVRRIDLSRYAKAKLPRAAHLLREGNNLYISLQRLNENYVPQEAGLLVALQIDTFRLSDKTFALPCTNPVSNLVKQIDTGIYVACAGNWFDHNRGAAVVEVDLKTGQTTTLADAAQLLGGRPGDTLRLDPDGNLITLLTTMQEGARQPATRMHVVRINAHELSILHTVDDYSLSGLAIDHRGQIYVGNRSQVHAGLWVLHDRGGIDGPWETLLPPADIDIRP